MKRKPLNATTTRKTVLVIEKKIICLKIGKQISSLFSSEETELRVKSFN